MAKVIHFEIMGKDAAKLRKFYEEVVGWKFNDSGMDGMEYLLADTGAGIGIDGALMSNPTQSQVIINTIEVEDVEATIKKVIASGGSLDGDGQVHDIPGVGKHAYIKDPEGIIHGILKPTDEFNRKNSDK